MTLIYFWLVLLDVSYAILWDATCQLYELSIKCFLFSAIESGNFGQKNNIVIVLFLSRAIYTYQSLVIYSMT